MRNENKYVNDTQYGNRVSVFLLSLSRVLDTVSRDMLLQKLSSYGTDVSERFTEYLFKRKEVGEISN